MALRQLVINKKLSKLNAELEALDFDAINKRSVALEASVDEAKSDEEFEVIENEADKIEEDRKLLEEQKHALVIGIDELVKELLDLEKTEVATPQEGERKVMNENTEQRASLNAFVRGKAQERNFTSTEGAALIPESVAKPVVDNEDRLDLTHLVNVVKVNTPSGNYPVISLSDSVMVTVEELEANPLLANPTVKNEPFSVETYRGYTPISQELIDDADYDVTGLIRDNIEQIELNTKNAKIVAILKAATPKAVTGVDGIKALLNVTLPRKYGRRAIISASLYNALDTAKDSNGRYLLQDDVTALSGKSIFGINIEVLDDEVIGAAAGDLVGFFGDSKRAVTLFDRKQATVEWANHNLYGKMLMGVTRFQVKATDAKAGFYVTFTPTPEV